MTNFIFKGKIPFDFNPTIYFDSRHMNFNNIFDPSSYSNHVLSNTFSSFENDEVWNHVSSDNIITFNIMNDYFRDFYFVMCWWKYSKCRNFTKITGNYTSDQPHITVPHYLSQM